MKSLFLTIYKLCNSHFIVSLSGFLILLIVFFLRCKNILFVPYIFAEDGKIFISRFLWEDSSVSVLFKEYAGYLHLLTSFVAFTCVSVGNYINNIEFIPFVMNKIALLLSVLCIFYFCSKDFSSIVKKSKNRLLIVIMVVLMFPQNGNDPNYSTSEIWGTITNIQWWFSCFLCLVLLGCFLRQCYPSYLNVFIIFIIGLSTADIIHFYFYFILLSIFLLFTRQFSLSHSIKFLLISSSCIVQFIYIFSFGTRVDGAVSNLFSVNVWNKILSNYLLIIRNIFKNNIELYSNPIPGAVIIFSFLLLVVGLCYFRKIHCRKKNMVAIAFLSIYGGSHLAFCFFSTKDLPVAFNNRYGFLTVFTIILLLCIVLVNLKFKYIKRLLITFIFLLSIPNIYFSFIPNYPEFYRKYSSLFNNKGENKLFIPLHSAYWGVYVPCNDIVEDYDSIIDKTHSLTIKDVNNVCVEDNYIINDWNSLTIQSNELYTYTLIQYKKTFYPFLIKDKKQNGFVNKYVYYGYLPYEAIDELIELKIIGIR